MLLQALKRAFYTAPKTLLRSALLGALLKNAPPLLGAIKERKVALLTKKRSKERSLRSKTLPLRNPAFK
jgi:hypothetical protein